MSQSSTTTRPLLQFAALCGALGLVTAMAFPPFVLTGGGREKARRANCSSNLRQIGLCFAMYADLYDGRLPMDSDQPTLVGSLMLLSNVTSSTKIFHCPSDFRKRATATPSFDSFSISNISYSYVPNLIWRENPDAVVMLDRTDSYTKGSKWPARGNHKIQGGNILFADGHVEFKSALPSDLRDKDGRIRVLSP